MYTGHITREEFGVHVFETVALIHGIRALESQIAGAIHAEQDRQLQDLKARRLALKAELAERFKALSDDDTASILQRYPYAASM